MSTLPAHNCAVCGRFAWCEMVPVIAPSRRSREVLTLPVCDECGNRLFAAEAEVSDAPGVMSALTQLWGRLELSERILMLRLFQIARRGE
ncbi:MAG: hypothetical protein JWM27_888 [Gemmatimonadetes bacterium]|nr:hypothetical protein [Gemmatimonadota bacterium]